MFEHSHNVKEENSHISIQSNTVTTTKKSRESIVKIKQILSRLLLYIQDKPMRIKLVSQEITNLLQREHSTKAIVEDTIKKRVYDVILVMNGVGLVLKNNKKEFYVTKEDSLKTKLPLADKEKQHNRLLSSINTKRLLIEKMQVFANVLEQKVLIKSSKKNKSRVDVFGMVGLLMKKDEAKFNKSGNLTKISGVTEIISNLELLAKL